MTCINRGINCLTHQHRKVVVGQAFTGDGTASFVAGADIRQFLEEIHTVEEARVLPANIQAFKRLAKFGPYLAGDSFTMADCAAAPALFYADWTHPIAASYPRLRAYRARLLARPSFAQAVEGGRPYRHYFPLGAPDRD